MNQVVIRAVQPAISISEATPDDVEAELVNQLVSGRAALPVLPAVASAALELADDPNATVGKMARLVEKDPPICARFVSLANSAIYARGRRIDNIHDAIVRVGLSASRDLLFQVVYASSTSGLKHYQAEVTRSFQRSVSCAVICRAATHVLAERNPEAYLAGLLHDIGESRVYRILAQMKRPPPPALAATLAARHHTSAGAEIARTWKLPNELVRVCLEHHDPGPPATPALRLVRLSDALVDSVEAQALGEARPPEPERLVDLSCSAKDVASVIERAARDAAKG